jgi:hypothetical protein
VCVNWICLAQDRKKRSCRWFETVSLNCGQQRAWAQRTRMEWCRQRKAPDFDHQSSLAVLPAKLPSSKTRGTGEGMMNFALWSNSLILRRFFFQCREILWHGANGFTSPPKEGILYLFSPYKFIALGRVWTREPWLNWKVTLTARPPRTTILHVKYPNYSCKFLRIFSDRGMYALCFFIWLKLLIIGLERTVLYFRRWHSVFVQYLVVRGGFPLVICTWCLLSCMHGVKWHHQKTGEADLPGAGEPQVGLDSLSTLSPQHG